MHNYNFKIQDCFCLKCGSKMLVDDIDDYFCGGVYTDVYYTCPNCSMSLRRIEGIDKISCCWFDGETQSETVHTYSKFKGVHR